MRQAGNPSSVDRLRMREMLVFKRTIPGKSPARRIAAERYHTFEKNRFHIDHFDFPTKSLLSKGDCWKGGIL